MIERSDWLTKLINLDQSCIGCWPTAVNNELSLPLVIRPEKLASYFTPTIKLFVKIFEAKKQTCFQSVTEL